MREPKWLELARADIGIAEIAGPQANPKIMAYFAAAGADWADGDEVPWCGAAMAGWMAAAGYVPPPLAVRARTWLEWGTPIETPRPGAVVILQRAGNPKLGHVALFVEARADRVVCLGGNQGNAVSISAYPKRDVIGYRWPAGAPTEPPPVTTADLEGSRKVAVNKAAEKTLITVGGGAAAAEVAHVAQSSGVTLFDFVPLIKQFAADHAVLLIVGGCFAGLLVTETIKQLVKQDVADGRYTPSGGGQ